MLTPAAIALDVDGWGSEGWLLLEQLKNDVRTGAIAVIVVSASGDRERAGLLGANGFVPKPVDRDQLLDALAPFAKHSTSF